MHVKQVAPPNETISQYVWTLLILAFFCVQAVVWLVALSLTANDRSQAIVAGYDEKALKWDEQRAEQRASDELSWSAHFQIDDPSHYGSQRCVAVYLTDRQQLPVAGSHVELTVFHCGHAADKQVQQLTEVEAGVYSASFKFEFTGHWDLSLVATRDNEQFLWQQRVEVLTTGGTE